MAWSANPEDPSDGRRKRTRRGPRWVTDHARDVAGQAQREDSARRKDSRSRAADPADVSDRRGRYAADPEPSRYPAPARSRYEPPTQRQRRGPSDRSRYGHDDYGRDRRHDDGRYDRDRGRYDNERYADNDRYADGDNYPDRGDYAHHGYDDHGYASRDDHDEYSRRDYSRDHVNRDDRDYVNRDDRDYDDWPDTLRRSQSARDTNRGPGPRDPGDVPERPTHLHETADTPKKLTVFRVAAWRGRRLAQNGVEAFRRAATADGADRSGLTALTFPVMASFAADAAVAVALANTLFFSAATAESKTKVALYLLITVAPFALVAPVIGPLLDRLQRGRRLALAASFAGRGLLALVMARHFGDWLLYPAALGSMVLSRSFGLLKAATTPRVLPPEMTLTKVNSRLAVFGLAAGGVVGAVAAGFAWAFGSAGALVFTTAVCAVGAWLCLRIPAWVEVTEGEVPASLRHPDDTEPVREGGGKRRREPLGRHVVVALWGNGTIRILTGFLTLFVAFVVKAQTEHSPWEQIVLLGMVGAAAGIGNIAGNALGARQHFDKPDQVILACVGIVLGASILAALVAGIATAVVVGLVGSTCSSLAKVCQDAVIQRDMSQESVASAFGRTETILQLSWTFGGALGVLMPPTYWLGFTIVSALLALGTAQTVMAHRGGSLIPRLGGDRPIVPAALRRFAATRPWRTGHGSDRQPSHPEGRP